MILMDTYNKQIRIVNMLMVSIRMITFNNHHWNTHQK
jgi:hypothetical protein